MKKKFTFLIAALMLLTMINLPKLVMGQASVGTTMWAETWTGATTATGSSNNATPSANYGHGTTVYDSGTVTYSQSANTVYVRNENTGGGTAPELLLSSSTNWTISNIPTGNATELTLTYKSNNTKSSVTCSTDGVTITGSSKSYTITPNGAETITLMFSSNSNTRIDDVSLTVKTAGSSDEATSVVIDHSDVINNIYGDNTVGGSFSATVLNSSDEEIDGATVSWNSSNTSVASIDSSTGEVTLVAVGSTTITASYAGSSGSYQSSFATYTLTVVNENPAIKTIWSEDFSDYSANDVPSGGTYSYACTDGNGGGTTKVYAATNAGGTSPELLVAKSSGTFTATIPLLTSTYGYSGDLTLKYKQNANSLNVKTITSGITVEGEASEGTGITNGTAGEKTITFKGVTTLTENITIVFTATTGSNVRLDDIVLKGTQAELTNVATPVITPASGAVAYGTEVTITCATNGASIYYTTNGDTPTSSSTPYNPASKPTITASTTIKAIAVKYSLTDSEVASASYTIAAPCATPTFSVAAGEVDKGTTVTISTETVGATIYYTTDGTSPTTSSTTYSSAITINSAMTIKAIAVKEGYANSELASATYTVIDYATLPFIWAGGTSSALTALTGVTASGLGSDYAESNAPYRVKMDGANDNIQIKIDCQPAHVTIGVKMLGGGTTSKIKIQESADGSDFTDVEEFTISGTQNDILNLASTNVFSEATRYVKIIKSVHGSNIGVGPISIYKNMPAPFVDENNEIVSDVTIGNGEYLIISSLIKIPSGKKITVSNTGILVNNNPANLIIEDGGQLVTNNAVQATVHKTIDGHDGSADAGWKFIASPIAGNTLPTNVGGMINSTTGNYDLYRFTQNPVIVDNDAKHWENYKAHTGDFNLTNGLGYLYANADGADLIYTGTINPGTSSTYTVDLDYTEGTIEEGWNLIGNPFTCNATINKSFYVISGHQANASTGLTTIAPCTGVMVMAEGENETVTFTKAPEAESSTVIRGMGVNLTGEEDVETIDNAIVSFNEGSELLKFYFGTQNANIYIPMDNEEFAIVSSNGQGEMPVNFRAYVAGEYTITVNPEEVEMGYLHLIDNIAGKDVDLLANPSYTFNARTDDYESRFRLVFSTTMVNAEMGEDFAFMSDGQLVIANEGEATLQVIDVTGRVVATENINGTCSKAINAKAGVYVLRLINGTDVKTQKMVIR